MAETRFASSADGTRIAFDVNGEGPALMLLHGGFIQTRLNWHEAGFVTRLQHEFRVITVDLRGHGESDGPREPAAYEIEKLCQDLDAVAEAVRADRFSVWGFSLGGTITLHAASRSERLRRAVVAGSYFGPLITREQSEASFSMLQQAAAAKASGELDKFVADEQRRKFFEHADLEVAAALTRAMSVWPPVEPSHLKCRALLYSGSLNKAASDVLIARRAEAGEVGIEIEIFEGLDHSGEFNAIDTVFPRVWEFLK